MDSCIVCFEKMTDVNIVVYPCHKNHKIHLTCYKDCYKNGHIKCLFCRSSVYIAKKNTTLLDITFADIIFVAMILGIMIIPIFIPYQNKACDIKGV